MHMVTLFVFCSNVGMKSSSPPSANESSNQQYVCTWTTCMTNLIDWLVGCRTSQETQEIGGRRNKTANEP